MNTNSTGNKPMQYGFNQLKLQSIIIILHPIKPSYGGVVGGAAPYDGRGKKSCFIMGHNHIIHTSDI